MKLSTRDSIKKLHAFTPGDVLAAYMRGTRDFDGINFLRDEIETLIPRM